MTMAAVKSGDPMSPVALLRDNEAQVLMDDLWRCGMRPTEAQTGDATLEAKDAHISTLKAAVARHCHMEDALLEVAKPRRRFDAEE